jgi:5'-3' exonuclease
MRIVTTGLIAGIGLLSVACASSPQPTERLASAQAAVRAAKEVGAKEVPQAQLHTQLAEEQVVQANKLIKDGDNERAEMILRRATADAELAVALAREAESQRQAQAAESELGPQAATPATTLQATSK